MTFSRSLMSLQIGLPSKLFIASTDFARPYSWFRYLFGFCRSLLLSRFPFVFVLRIPPQWRLGWLKVCSTRRTTLTDCLTCALTMTRSYSYGSYWMLCKFAVIRGVSMYVHFLLDFRGICHHRKRQRWRLGVRCGNERTQTRFHSRLLSEEVTCPHMCNPTKQPHTRQFLGSSSLFDIDKA